MDSVDVRHEDFEFVDLGSGKGKALLLASDYPFKRIIGVEFSPVLHLIALDNISRYRTPTQRCRNIKSICQDATEFDFPMSPLLVHLYNPFGPDTLGRVLERLEASLSIQPRPCFVVMVYPLWARVVRERGNFIESGAGEFFATFRYKADHI
jgi:SAM-dependent methyltransferase